MGSSVDARPGLGPRSGHLRPTLGPASPSAGGPGHSWGPLFMSYSPINIPLFKLVVWASCLSPDLAIPNLGWDFPVVVILIRPLAQSSR